jgi:hypothetical protein
VVPVVYSFVVRDRKATAAPHAASSGGGAVAAGMPADRE